MTEETKVAMYVAKEAPQLRVKLDRGEGKKPLVRKFEHGKLELTDPAEIKQLDEMLAEGAGIARYVQKVDRDAALEMARKHQELYRAQNATAKGTTTSVTEADAMREARKAHDEIAAKADANIRQQIDDDTAKKMADEENLQLTERVDLSHIGKEAPAENSPAPEAKPKTNSLSDMLKS